VVGYLTFTAVSELNVNNDVRYNARHYMSFLLFYLL
jgi:hypothetical protein